MQITAGLPFETSFTLTGTSAADGWAVAARIGTADPIALTGTAEEWTLALDSTATTALTLGDAPLYLIGTLAGSEKLLQQTPATIIALGTVSHARQMVTLLEARSKQLGAKQYIDLTTPSGEAIKLDREGIEAQLKKYRAELATETRLATGQGKIATVNYRPVNA